MARRIRSSSDTLMRGVTADVRRLTKYLREEQTRRRNLQVALHKERVDHESTKAELVRSESSWADEIIDHGTTREILEATRTAHDLDILALEAVEQDLAAEQAAHNITKAELADLKSKGGGPK